MKSETKRLNFFAIILFRALSVNSTQELLTQLRTKTIALSFIRIKSEVDSSSSQRSQYEQGLLTRQPHVVLMRYLAACTHASLLQDVSPGICCAIGNINGCNFSSQRFPSHQRMFFLP